MAPILEPLEVGEAITRSLRETVLGMTLRFGVSASNLNKLPIRQAVLSGVRGVELR